MRYTLGALELAPWLRLIGLVMLGILLLQSDLGRLGALAKEANLPLIIVSLGANFPLIAIKAFRLKVILRPHAVSYEFGKAYLAYWSSIYLGLLTPGRLGEFARVAYVRRDCNVSTSQGLSSVLTDRILDLYALLAFGGIAIMNLKVKAIHFWVPVCAALFLTLPLALFLHPYSFSLLRRYGRGLGKLGEKVFAGDQWLSRMRSSLCQLSWSRLAGAICLTILAYTLFFVQCYLIALALDLQLGLIEVTYVSAMGSLVTLLPISISGLGTREAAIVAYLHTLGVPQEMALGFSLMLFANFHVAGGLIGAVAWSIRPLPLAELLKGRSKSKSLSE